MYSEFAFLALAMLITRVLGDLAKRADVPREAGWAVAGLALSPIISPEILAPFAQIGGLLFLFFYGFSSLSGKELFANRKKILPSSAIMFLVPFFGMLGILLWKALPYDLSLIAAVAFSIPSLAGKERGKYVVAGTIGIGVLSAFLSVQQGSRCL